MGVTGVLAAYARIFCHNTDLVRVNGHDRITPPIGRTACTEPQCLYKGALYPMRTSEEKKITSM